MEFAYHVWPMEQCGVVNNLCLSSAFSDKSGKLNWTVQIRTFSSDHKSAITLQFLSNKPDIPEVWTHRLYKRLNFEVQG